MDPSSNPRFQHRLLFRQGLIAAGFAVLMMFVFQFAQSFLEFRREETRQEQILLLRIEPYLERAALAASGHDRILAGHVVEEVIGFPSLWSVRLKSASGELLAELSVSHPAHRFSWLCQSLLGGARVFDYPLAGQGKDGPISGVLTLTADPYLMQSAFFERTLDSLLFLALMAPLIALAFFFIVHRTVGRSLTGLTRSIRAIHAGAGGKIRIPIPAGHENDEIGLLAKTANRLMEDVEARQAQLERANAALTESEERFRNLIEGSIQAVLVHRDLKPLFVNDTFVQMAGFKSIEEVLALPSLEVLLEKEKIEEVLSKRKEAKEQGQPVPSQIHFNLNRPDGVKLQIESYAREVSWEGETAIQATLLDVTQRSELEMQLRQSQKMEALGELASGMGSEFNHTLQIMKGFTEMLQNGQITPKTTEKHLARVESAMDRSSNLIRQLQTLNRRTAIRPEVLRMDSLLADWAPILNRLMGDSVEVSVQVKEDGGVVKADSGLLEQVLLNLCVNARDAMADGGVLAIEARSFDMDEILRGQYPWARQERYELISIRDTGQGIPHDMQEKIFDPYFTTKPGGQGSGLGLSTAYGIVTQHGGMIDVKSEPGMGTTFNIFLPSLRESPHAAESSVLLSEPGGSETILVADDEWEVLDLAVKLLKRKGYRVLTAINGEEAYKLFMREKDAVDMVILDMVMPLMNGKQLYEKIRAYTQDIPVLFCSGYSESLFDPSFVSSPDFQILHKPYRARELYHAVRAALDDQRTVA